MSTHNPEPQMIPVRRWQNEVKAYALLGRFLVIAILLIIMAIVLYEGIPQRFLALRGALEDAQAKNRKLNESLEKETAARKIEVDRALADQQGSARERETASAKLRVAQTALENHQSEIRELKRSLENEVAARKEAERKPPIEIWSVALLANRTPYKLRYAVVNSEDGMRDTHTLSPGYKILVMRRETDICVEFDSAISGEYQVTQYRIESRKVVGNPPTERDKKLAPLSAFESSGSGIDLHFKYNRQ